MNNSLLLTELPPLSLYIHIPWCVRKCPYCDFNSHTSDAIPEQSYVHALLQDIDLELPFVQGRKLVSIFFGGGTPSLFSPQAINDILEGVQKRIPFQANIEISLEANPGTVEQDKFNGLFEAGVNRLSIGIQSFNEEHLKKLGRVHNANEAIAAATAAKKAGFTNFNLDLMHGLPKQTEQSALADLQQAIDLKPSHLSWYQLTIEPNTAFYNNPPLLPDEDTLADIQIAGEQLIQQSGFHQYEVSAYSLSNQQAKHNLNYWQFGDYIGIGAGAHGKLTDLTSQTITRRWKTRAPLDYLNPNKSFLAGEKKLTPDELPLEFMMNSLRLNAGFSLEMFQRRTGIPPSIISRTITSLIQRQLLSDQSSKIRTTELGRRFLNSVLAEF